MKSQRLDQTKKMGDAEPRFRLSRLGLISKLATVSGCVMAMPTPTYAVDGCTVLLCLAAPSWRSVEQCVPPIRQLLRDLVRGKAFPICAMAGSGSSSSHAWSAAPDFCPPQYTRSYDAPHGPVYTCDYAGAITVMVGSEPFARTWWSLDGDAVTEFSPAAKGQLGSWERRFDDDFAAWLASRQPPSVIAY